MNKKVVDVVVIGCGAMGSSTCAHLAQRGASVIGIEKYGRAHNMGSSGGYSRLYRESYHEHPDYVPLALRSGLMWEEMEQKMNCKLINRSGFLLMGEPSSETITGVLDSVRTHNLPHTIYEREALMNKWPQFNLPEGHVGVFDPRAGVVDPLVAI